MNVIKIENVCATLAVAAMFLFAGVGFASAATFTDVEFENGDTEIQGKGGETVEATLRLTVNDGEVVERIEIDNNYNAPKCVRVGGTKGLEEGTHYVDVDVKLPPNTGEYDLDVSASGIYGAGKAIDCENDVVGSDSFMDALIVEGSQVEDDDVGSSELDTLKALVAELKAQLKALLEGNTIPVGPAWCAQLKTMTAATFPGMSGPNVSALQSFLIGTAGQSIPAIQFGGAAYGFYGSQTSTAVAGANAQCK